uniref:Uncharacterized protein n=1 Tax=Amphimedon queenslandica TaxID=400682 RepID=A0A1X7SJ09_AMPQE
MLRILRNASVHYPLLRCLLKHFYVARNAQLTIDITDSSLAEGDRAQLTNLESVKLMRLNLIMCIMLLMMVKKMTNLEYQT